MEWPNNQPTLDQWFDPISGQWHGGPEISATSLEPLTSEWIDAASEALAKLEAHDIPA